MLDITIRKLQQRREILLLHAEIQQLEADLNTSSIGQPVQPAQSSMVLPNNRQSPTSSLPPTLEISRNPFDVFIAPYSGDDAYLVREWFQDVKDNTQYDYEHFRFSCAVRALTGSARTIYRMSIARNWNELKALLPDSTAHVRCVICHYRMYTFFSMPQNWQLPTIAERSSKPLYRVPRTYSNPEAQIPFSIRWL